MKLYVMRHGPAEDTAESGRDFDRALTSSGRDRVRSVAKALVAEEEAPASILTSPLLRAVQTAEIVAHCIKHEPQVETRFELAPGGPQAHLVRQMHADGRKRVMVVGHEPDLSGLVGELLGARMSVPMQKAMVVGLRLDDQGRVKLRFVLDPKTLAWSGRDD
jgi:phosphohistidine phosphatase